MVKTYLRPRTAVGATRNGAVISGRLVDSSGHGIADAHLHLQANYPTGKGNWANHSASGPVPEAAVSAILGVRINTECNCSKDADVGFRNVQLTETGDPATPLSGQSLYQKTDWQVAGRADVSFDARGGEIAIRANKDQSAQLNLGHAFPVHAGGAFALNADIRTSEASGDSGELIVIFKGANGHEIGRKAIPIRAAPESKGDIVTGPDGHFSFDMKGVSFPAEARVQIAYPGSQDLWPSLLAVK